MGSKQGSRLGVDFYRRVWSGSDKGWDRSGVTTDDRYENVGQGGLLESQRTEASWDVVGGGGGCFRSSSSVAEPELLAVKLG